MKKVLFWTFRLLFLLAIFVIQESLFQAIGGVLSYSNLLLVVIIWLHYRGHRRRWPITLIIGLGLDVYFSGHSFYTLIFLAVGGMIYLLYRQMTHSNKYSYLFLISLVAITFFNFLENLLPLVLPWWFNQPTRLIGANWQWNFWLGSLLINMVIVSFIYLIDKKINHEKI